jgi:pilus assembly protein Flp/PilA
MFSGNVKPLPTVTVRSMVLSSNRPTEIYATLGSARALVGIGDLPRNPKDANLKRTFLNFLTDETGATAIEYCLIAAGIALAIIAIVQSLGINLVAMLTSLNDQLK